MKIKNSVFFYVDSTDQAIYINKNFDDKNLKYGENYNRNNNICHHLITQYKKVIELFKQDDILMIIQQKFFNYYYNTNNNTNNNFNKYPISQFSKITNNNEIFLFSDDANEDKSINIYYKQLHECSIRYNSNIYFLIGKPSSIMSKIYSTNSRNLTDNDYLFNDKKGEKDESYDSPDIKYVEEFSNIIKHNNKITGLCI